MVIKKRCKSCKKLFDNKRKNGYFLSPNQFSKTSFCSTRCVGITKIGGIGYWRNKRQSSEHVKKRKDASKSYRPTEETRLKMSLARKGKPLQEQARLKISGKNSKWWKDGISKDTQHYSRRRRVLKLKASGSHSVIEWQKLKKDSNYICLCCKRYEPEIKLTEDHIIPLTKGGSDNIENIQPLCRSCNSRKGNRNSTNYKILIAN